MILRLEQEKLWSFKSIPEILKLARRLILSKYISFEVYLLGDLNNKTILILKNII